MADEGDHNEDRTDLLVLTVLDAIDKMKKTQGSPETQGIFTNRPNPDYNIGRAGTIAPTNDTEIDLDVLSPEEDLEGKGKEIVAVEP